MIIFGVSTSTVATQVYRCVSNSGAVEFREWPCQTSIEHSTVLPYPSKKTDPTVAIPMESHTTLSLMADKKRVREESRLKKRSEEARLKAKRRQDRCVNTEEKIKGINKQLRAGCKPRRCNRLKEQLNHFEIMKARYCQSG